MKKKKIRKEKIMCDNNMICIWKYSYWKNVFHGKLKNFGIINRGVIENFE